MLKIITVLFIFFAVLALFLHWSNKALTVTSYRFCSSAVPAAFDGFRIVQVSDLQSEYFGKGQSSLLKTVQEAGPDLIVFTGDLADRNHTDYEASLAAVKGLAEIAPVYYVNGNHEMALPEEEISGLYFQMEEAGISMLLDKTVRVGPCGRPVKKEEGGEPALCLMGLSETSLFAAKGILGLPRGAEEHFDESFINDMIQQLRTEAEEDDLTVLLVHEPQYLDVYAGAMGERECLAFAGHAHGGQIRLPFTQGLFAPGQGVLPRLTDGIHRSGQTALVISRGLGNSTFPFRVFNRPEVVVCQLRQERTSESES